MMKENVPTRNGLRHLALVVDNEKYSLSFSSPLADSLRTCVDKSSFSTVNHYLRNPTSEIEEVALVAESLSLPEIGAIFVSGARQQLKTLISLGFVRQVLPDGLPENTVLNVLYLPPAYLIQFADSSDG